MNNKFLQVRRTVKYLSIGVILQCFFYSLSAASHAGELDSEGFLNNLSVANVSLENSGNRLSAADELPEAEIIVSGTITDDLGEPLPGVNIIVLGTSHGTVTSIDGTYRLNVDENATLVISFIGFLTEQVPVNGRSVIDMSLMPDIMTMDEVVVVGYGTVKRQDLTGSVSQVQVEKIQDIPANSVEGLLQGRVAGLQVTSSSQDPGAGSTVIIRGASSLRGSKSPLLVVDGFPLGDAGDLKQINPSDIVSIDILKDASASAIYGSRGANGVILVTTRKPKTGKTQVSVTQQTTVSQFTSELNLWRDPVLMAQLNNESRLNGGFQPQYIGAVNPAGIYYPSIAELSNGSWPHNTRWDDIVFRDAPVSNNTTVSVSSSNEKTNFSFSGNYYTDKGMYIDDDYSKLGYNFNVDHKLLDNLKLTFSNILSRGKRNNNGGLAYWRNPIWPIYNENGEYFLTDNNDYGHPVAISENRLNTSKSLDVLSFLDLEWKIMPSLTLTSRMNYKYGASIEDEYQPMRYTEGGSFNNGAAYMRNREWQDFVSETFANYNKLFGKHEIGATIGYSYENNTYRGSELGAFDFVNEILKNQNMGAGNPEKNTVGNDHRESELVSGIFRVNYGFNDKYLLTFTSRVDGSSKFGANNKWAYFPSGAISWKAHEEEFVSQLGVFDELKLRASYGISGNQGIDPYWTLSRYGLSNYYNKGNWFTAIGPGYEVGRAGQDGIEVVWGGISNPDLRWETTAQANLGVDMGFFDNRLNVIFDYYEKKTDDLLRERFLAPSSGYDKMWVNDGSVSNKGIELTLDGNIINTQDLNFNATLIYSQNKNKITRLGTSTEYGLTEDPNSGMLYEIYSNDIEMFRKWTNILAVGQPMQVFYGYKTNGIIQSLEEGIEAGLDGDLARPGEFKYVDINDDGVIDEKDQTIIGDPHPDFMMSLALNLTYKKFDFGIFFNGVFGNDVLNTQAFNQPSNTPLRWTVDNPANDYPGLRDGRQNKFSDWWIEDGSFVRIQNVNLGYTFDLPKNIKARVFANASNLFTFTKFEGYDPEVGGDGIYWGGYPRLRKMTLGVNVTF